MDIEKINALLERIGGKTILRPIYKEAVRKLAPNTADVILDFGCGCGNTARLLVDKVNRLVCLDIDRNKIKMIKAALKGKGNVEFVNKKITECNYIGVFNKINAIYVLHDLSNIELKKTIQEFKRSLLYDGIVHVYEPKKENHGIDPGLLKDVFLEAGFSLVSEYHKKSAFRMVFKSI